VDREKLEQAALKLGESVGLANVSKRMLCESAGIPEGSFQHIIGETFTEFITALGEHKGFITTSRCAPKFRRAAILESAIVVAEQIDGWGAITREAIAEQARVSPGLVSHVLGDMDFIKDQVMEAAVKREIVSIVTEGLALGNTEALKASKALRAKITKYISARV
jgi:DNA-binding transcriptional regulator YbjK